MLPYSHILDSSHPQIPNIMHMHCKSAFLALFLLLLTFTGAGQQYEKDYIALIQQHLGGQMEVVLKGGRADIVNDTYAIEVEFAPKWKNAIGQALWYGLQTGKQPGIVIILRETSEYPYFAQLGSALSYAGLDSRVKVWLWPTDFPGAEAIPRSVAAPAASPSTGYWLTSSSQKRHNAQCRYFKNSTGRDCTATEGTPCGLCKG